MTTHSPKHYKVWIEIEEYDEVTEQGRDVSAELLDFASVADFTTETAAIRFATRLEQTGQQLSSEYVDDLVSI